jgi:hypothetical protein
LFGRPSRGRWTVSQANLAAQSPLAVRDGVTIYQAVFERAPGGVRLVGTQAVFRLRGFLYPPTERLGTVEIRVQ